MMTGTALPSGLVTFLFTDVEGSTVKWEEDREAMSASLRVHDEILREEITARGGYVFTTAGDAFCAAFERPTEAVEAAAIVQTRLGGAVWPGPELRVRMGLHLGEAEERDGDYFGPVVNLGARVQSAAHGGQVVMTSAVREAASVEGLGLGRHQLKDVAEEVVLWQLGDKEFPPLRTAVNPSKLPSPATRLFGRSDEARDVRVLLRDSRLVTIVAVGGTGKTRLAIEVAHQELDDWRDGVWFADLTQANTDDQVALVVARALGLETRSDDPEAEVAEYVGGRILLLVLDNCEHVADGSAELATAILEAGGPSAVLATSREWLDVDGERVVQVRSLPSGGADSPAVRLFTDRATAVDSSFRLDATTTDAVVELCDRLDGIPLAIELAASRVAVLSPARLLEGLDDRFQLLSGGRRRQRRRTLEATIDWSYDLLDLEDQQVFRHLGVFAGSFDLDAVEVVCELSRTRALDTIESLYARSLVVRSDDWPDRFRLLETLKAYAEDRLVDEGEAADARRRHLEHFLARAQVDDWRWGGGDARRAGALIPDTANLTLCLDQLEAAARWDDLADLLTGLSTVMQGDDTYLQRIHQCREQLSDTVRHERLLLCLIQAEMWSADWPSYIAHCRELTASDDRDHASYGFAQLALVAGRHDPARATRYVDRFVESGPPEPDDARRTLEAFHRAYCAAHALELADARHWVSRGLDAARRAEHVQWVVPMLEAVRAVCAWADGDLVDLDGAVERIDRSFEPIGVVDGGSQYARRFVAIVAAVARGAIDEATPLVKEFAVDAAAGRVKLIASDALVFLAALSAAEGDRDRASALILATTAARTPAGNAAILLMADELGVRDAVDRQYLERQLDLDWVLTAADAPLRSELDGRGWL